MATPYTAVTVQDNEEYARRNLSRPTVPSAPSLSRRPQGHWIGTPFGEQRRAGGQGVSLTLAELGQQQQAGVHPNILAAKMMNLQRQSGLNVGFNPADLTGAIAGGMTIPQHQTHNINRGLGRADIGLKRAQAGAVEAGTERTRAMTPEEVRQMQVQSAEQERHTDFERQAAPHRLKGLDIGNRRGQFDIRRGQSLLPGEVASQDMGIRRHATEISGLEQQHRIVDSLSPEQKAEYVMPQSFRSSEAERLYRAGLSAKLPSSKPATPRDEIVMKVGRMPLFTDLVPQSAPDGSPMPYEVTPQHAQSVLEAVRERMPDASDDVLRMVARDVLRGLNFNVPME